MVLLGAMLLIASEASAVVVQAHRGGSMVEGVATFPENSMAAFEHSLAEGWVIELDVGVTADGAPVVMHDATLDRTTDCTGPVDGISLADLGDCRIDRLGTGGASVPLDPGDPRLEPVPTLDQVIALLKQTGGRANIEIKVFPTIHPEVAPLVYNRLAASGIPSKRIILQNFLEDNLTEAKSLYPGVATSLLSTGAVNDGLVARAIDAGVDWVSPQWPVGAGFVTEARAAGKKIVPYTIDDATEMEAAADLGVDSLITNDPTLAERLVGTPWIDPPPVDPPPVEPVPVEPKPSLSLKLSGKTRVRAGRAVRVVARIKNSGEGDSAPATLRVRPGRSGLRLRGPRIVRVPAIAAGSARLTRFALVAKPRRKGFGRFPVKFVLSQDGLDPIRKSRRFLVQRPPR